jgi:PKD repeat protein
MRGHRLWAVGVAVAATALLMGRPAAGQEACYQGAGPSMVNICPTATQDIDYRINGAYGIAAATVNGVSYAFDIHGNSLDVYNVTDPTTPVRLTSVSVTIPWWPPPDGGSDPSLINRLRGLATLDGFPYAIGMFYTDGWDFFKLGTNTFLTKGYGPRLRTSYLRSAMFWNGAHTDVYAVGQLLDSTAIAANDVSVYVYHIWNGTTIKPETIDYTTMVNYRSRVPIGGSGDGAYSGFGLGAGSASYYPFVINGHPWLLVANSSKQAVTVDVGNPITPAATGAMWTTATDPNLFSGPWAVDSDHAILHVAGSDHTTVYSYDISNPASGPVPIASTAWHDASISPTCAAPAISAGGGVIAVGCGAYTGYVPIDQNGVPSPPALPADTGPTQATFVNPDQCSQQVSLGPYVKGLSVFVTPSQQTCVARAIYSWGDVIALNDACLSTVPAPAFDVTGGSTAASCTPSPPVTDLANKGFPGDTFTITDNSHGTVANGTLVLNPGAIKSWSESASHAWTPLPLAWASATNRAPGEYPLTMKLYDQSGTQYALTRSIYLCGNPLAGISQAPTPPYLTGDAVTLSAASPASQGSPSGYDWRITPPTGSSTNATGASYALSLAQTGLYHAYVRVHYAHTATSDSACSQSPFNSMPAGSGYDSCTSVTIDSEPFSVGALTLSQTPPPSGGTYLLGQPIGMSVPYKLGAGYTATFQWALDDPNNVIAAFNPTPPSVTAGGSSISGTVTGTIPANYFTVPGTHTVYLVASAGGGTIVPTPQPQATFNVVDCQPAVRPSGLNATVSGQAPSALVTFTWNSGGTSPVSYRVHDPLGLLQPFCTSTDVTTCTYTASGAGTYQYKVDASNACSGGTLTSTATGSFTVTGGSPPPPPPPTPTPTGNTPSANFSFAPTNPQVGQTIQFTDSSTNMTPGFGTLTWAWDFGDGLGIIGGGGHTSNVQNPTFAYDTARTYTVTLTVTNSYGSSTKTRQVAVSAPCTATAAPTASFSYASPARATIPVQFNDTSSGGPTAWSWDFGDGMPPILPAHTSNAQNPTNTFANPGTYTVTLVASNCKGQTTTSQQIQVIGSCDLTEPPPTPDFTWAPTGADPAYPQQQQPFVGQPVTLSVADTTTGEPTSWQWYDFQELMIPPTTVTSPTFTATWNEPGDKNVRMKANNCFGQSDEVLKTVHIYDDVRPVVADFTWSPTTDITTNTQVTFTASQGLAYGSPTTFNWTFDDGSTQTGATVAYSFRCGGGRTVTLTASRGSYTGTVSKVVSVVGQSCGPDSVMTVDAAKVQGLNGTSWRTDVRIFNPSSFTTSVTLQFLQVGQDNSAPFTVGPYRPPLPPMGTLVLNDILQWVHDTWSQNFSKTALRVTYDNPQDIAPMVMARTYTPGPTGGNYGQFAPGIAVYPGTTPGTIWITGLHNNGLDAGFRTNYSLLNLRGSGSGTIGLTLLNASGAALGTASVGLAPFGYLQDSVSKLFGGGFDTVGDFSIKVDVPAGADIQAYGSVVDNLTGDPSLIPAVAPANSPVFLPAIAHLPGEAGTVWRTDLMLTNPDMSGTHTWELTYTPKENGALSVVSRSVTLGPGASLSVNDLVSWIYGGTLAEGDQTSGIVRVGMGGGDGTGVYPIIAARSYNQTPSGTFGQNIVPMWAARGVSINSANKNLLIAGMSSEDIARTNLGFVNLSDTDGVNFSVLFYDESGNLLNPRDQSGAPTPLTVYLPPGSWDQDKLENRFQRAFKVNLPANERAVSAVITVTGGGPGTAYATVIDNQTGDPNFVPAEAAP